MTVVTERMDHLRSVSVGLFLRSGARHEPIEQSGISHFIEHMLFKGTEHRSAQEIAFETDSLGGTLDAFTSHEVAGYSLKALDEHLPRAFDLVADIISSPLFHPKEIAKERQVIIEEIKMTEDAPEELATELFLSNFWPNHRLGISISGNEASIEGLTRDDLHSYWQKVYTPANVVVAAAGRLEHATLVDLTEQTLGKLTESGFQQDQTSPVSAAPIVIHPKDHLEQVQIILGTECPSLSSKEHFPLIVMNTILGGGVSSRLFMTIREEHGLAYHIESAPLMFTDTGLFAIHAATSPQKAESLLDLTIAELRRLKEEPAPMDELVRTRELAKASMMLSLESSSARMSHLARNEIFFSRQFAHDEILREIEAVSAEDVQRVANLIFQPEHLALVVVGYVNGLQFERGRLAC
jgi:predicted Zn-dependent peptidase